MRRNLLLQKITNSRTIKLRKIQIHSSNVNMVCVHFYFYFFQTNLTNPYLIFFILSSFSTTSSSSHFCFISCAHGAGNLLFASWITVGSHFLLILELINLMDYYKLKEFISLIKRYNYFLPHHFRARLKTMMFNTLLCNYIIEKFI